MSTAVNAVLNQTTVKASVAAQRINAVVSTTSVTASVSATSPDSISLRSAPLDASVSSPDDGDLIIASGGTWGASAQAALSAPASIITSGTLAVARVPDDLSTKGVVGKGSLPAAGTAGRLWVDTDDGDTLKRDTGAGWEDVAGSGITWSQITDFAGSSLGDLATRSASDLSSGNLAYAQLPTGSGSWDPGAGETITITRSLTVSGALTGTLTGSVTGSAATLNPGRNINGTLFDGSANITVTAAAGTLTGSTLASGVTASSLTSLGTLTGLAVNGTARVGAATITVGATLEVSKNTGSATVTPVFVRIRNTNTDTGSPWTTGTLWGGIDWHSDRDNAPAARIGAYVDNSSGRVHGLRFLVDSTPSGTALTTAMEIPSTGIPSFPLGITLTSLTVSQDVSAPTIMGARWDKSGDVPGLGPASPWAVYRFTANNASGPGRDLPRARIGAYFIDDPANTGLTLDVSPAGTMVSALALGATAAFAVPVVTVASTTAVAGLRILPGTAPTSPIDGAVWMVTANGWYGRRNSATEQFLTTGATVTVAQGGTGLTSYTTGDLLYASASTTIGKLAAVAAGKFLRAAGTSTAPAWSAMTIPDTIPRGGILYASDDDELSVRLKGAANHVLAGDGNDPQWVANISANVLPIGSTSEVTWNVGVGSTLTLTRSTKIGDTLTVEGTGASGVFSTGTWRVGATAISTSGTTPRIEANLATSSSGTGSIYAQAPAVVRVRSTTSAADWTTEPWGMFDFVSGDVTGAGAGVRAAVGAFMESAGGGTTGLKFYTAPVGGLTLAMTLGSDLALALAGDMTIAGDVGFYGQTATAKPTGVAVTAEAVHAALVTLNLIAGP